MTPQKVAEAVGTLPYMTLAQGTLIGDIIKEYDCKSVLELGFFHGVSTCYIAGALDDLGGKRTITTIDLEGAKTDRRPNVEELLATLGLRDKAEVYYEPKSYNWRLMKFIEEGRRFDFCYVDGGHNWYDSGYAFFLVDKILNPGGLILFDDLYWSAKNMPDASDWPSEERTTKGVLKVWELLVCQHPDYEEVWIRNSWGLARKRPLQAGANDPRGTRRRPNLIHMLRRL